MSDDVIHYYTEYLNENSPLYTQPSKIKINLKPHQLAGLKKAIDMEQNEKVYYKDRYNSDYHYEVTTNVGIIGDKVGYGKTLLALSIVAESKLENMSINDKSINTYNTSLSYNYDKMKNSMIVRQVKHGSCNIRDNFRKTTLIVVPRGPVYTQWILAMTKQTELKFLVIDDLRMIKTLVRPTTNNIDQIKTYFAKYDAVLIKNTTLKKLITYMYHSSNFILYWSRIIVDEAHDILSTLGHVSYLYMWLISATYNRILYNKCSSTNSMYLLRDIINNETLHMLIKSSSDFIKNSFELPEMKEIIYKCKMHLKLSAIRSYLPRHLIERLDASDLQGAVRELGGKVASENVIVDMFTSNLRRDIHNKKCEYNHIQVLDISENDKNSRLESVNATIELLENRLQQLTSRLRDIDSTVCSICLESKNNPIFLDCTHSFCTSCLMIWMNTNRKCPECRLPITMAKTVSVDVNKDLNIQNDSNENKPKTKENTLISIINKKQDGKFLVFSKVENGFSQIKDVLSDNNITFTEIKGSTACMNNILARFRDGELKVILLNTHHAGSGIDISFATDVIIYHAMKEDKNQAIGRAYRVGRTIPLTVHTLLNEYENE